MIVRLDFGGDRPQARTIRISAVSRPGIHVLALLGPHLPFKADSVDEIHFGGELARADEFAATLAECWRVSKPGTMLYARLPHASSPWALSRDPSIRGRYTLETFNYFDPRRRERGDSRIPSFLVEQARLHLTAHREPARGVALARCAFAGIIESLANQNRGMQYRWERWFAPVVGGFEEFAVVLSAVKEPSYA